MLAWVNWTTVVATHYRAQQGNTTRFEEYLQTAACIATITYIICQRLDNNTTLPLLPRKSEVKGNKESTRNVESEEERRRLERRVGKGKYQQQQQQQIPIIPGRLSPGVPSTLSTGQRGALRPLPPKGHKGLSTRLQLNLQDPVFTK